MHTLSFLLAFSALLLPVHSKASEPLQRVVQTRTGHRVDRNHPVRVLKEIPELSLSLVELTDDSDLLRLENDPDILHTVVNRPIRVFQQPNDPRYQAYQKSILGSLNLETAWNRTTGTPSVIVAVIDSGIHLQHPDLKNRLWVNPGEVPGNGIDDDLNGKVDDVNGWNFLPDAATGIPKDQHGHGTHVSGIIGAEGNNGIGIAGVSWETQIMPLQILDQDGAGNMWSALEAIVYAADHGARIINASWGYEGYFPPMDSVIEYAFSKGTLLIAAAGNEGASSDLWPWFPAGSRHLPVLSVAASSGLSLASFSNHGPRTVHLAAPGDRVDSTYLYNSYAQMSGTSMAAPHVSGVAALILSLRPDLSANDLRNALLNAVTKTTLKNKIATDGPLDAARALEQLNDGFQIWPSRLRLEIGGDLRLTGFDGTAPIAWSVSDPLLADLGPDGMLHGLNEGEVTVYAQDAMGRTAQAQFTILSKMGQQPWGSGPKYKPSQDESSYERLRAFLTGCQPRRSNSSATPLEQQAAVVNLLLPFILAFWIRRRG